jgi:hypothetical protein
MSGRVINVGPLKEKKKVELRQVGMRSHRESNLKPAPAKARSSDEQILVPILGTVFCFRSLHR